MQCPHPEYICPYLLAREIAIYSYKMTLLKIFCYLYSELTRVTINRNLPYIKVHISRRTAHIKYWISLQGNPLLSLSFEIHTNAECIVKWLQMFKPEKFCSFYYNYINNFEML